MGGSAALVHYALSKPRNHPIHWLPDEDEDEGGELLLAPLFLQSRIDRLLKLGHRSRRKRRVDENRPERRG